DCIYAPRVFFPWVRGPGHEIIDKLTNQYDIEIYMSLTSNREAIVVSGESRGVRVVAEQIRAIVSEKRAITKTLTVTVNRAQHHLIEQNSGIDEILRITGVSVEMPEGVSEVITLRGEGNQLGAAVREVCTRASRNCSLSEFDGYIKQIDGSEIDAEIPTIFFFQKLEKVLHEMDTIIKVIPFPKKIKLLGFP
ncbi:hypothetical protein PENTCL1PPCAC_9108, partial [Pristionchus entomophagus]